MTHDPHAPSPRNRGQVLAWLAGFTAPPLPDEPLPPLSEELEQLLWLFAEDQLSDVELDRLCDLAAREPAASRHLSRMLERMRREAPADTSLLERALAAANSGPVAGRVDTGRDPASIAKPTSPTSLGSLATWMPDLRITVAADHLLASLFGLGDFAPTFATARGGSAEKRTTLEKQVLKSQAVYKLIVDHAGDHACHVTLAITQHQFRVPLGELVVQVRDQRDQVMQTEPVVDQAARLRNLGAGRLTLVVVHQGQVLDRIQLQFDPASEG